MGGAYNEVSLKGEI